MAKLNLREMITRTITYSVVDINSSVEDKTYIVYGETTEYKEMVKYLKSNPNKPVPTVIIKTITERRTMDLETFLNNTILINDKGEII